MSAQADNKDEEAIDDEQLFGNGNDSTNDNSACIDQTVLPGSNDSLNKTSCSVKQEVVSLPEPMPIFECPVCLQTANFPVKLPCKHIFCFLCVKGFANRSKRCALCRQEIPTDFFHDPKLLCREEVKEKSKTCFDEGYQWFYEGRNGWWQYDDRTSTELEKRYKDEDKVFELLIAGFLYVIDLENMRQFRRNDQSRRRRIKRDMQNTLGVKGIAGLKFNENQPSRPNGDGESSQADNSVNGAMQVSVSSSHPPSTSTVPSMLSDGGGPVPSMVSDGAGTVPSDDAYLTPPAPNNTPQTPMTPADSQPGSLSNSTEDLSNHLNSLQLTDNYSSSRGSLNVYNSDEDVD